MIGLNDAPPALPAVTPTALGTSHAWPWAEIVRSYQERARHLARSLVGDLHEADDVVQEAFRKAYRHRSRFAPGREVWPWLAGIIFYTALDWRRRSTLDRRSGSRGAGGDTAPEAVDDSSGPLTTLIRTEERRMLCRRVAAAMLSLTPFERLAFSRFFVADEPVSTIARSCGKSEGAVSCVLTRAKKKFMRFFPGVDLTNRELKEFFAR